MARRASKNWGDQEIKGLLSIWKDRSIQDQLAGTVRNKDVFVRISNNLKELGVNRDWKQCRAKVKNLKYEYRIMVNQRKSGRLCKSMRFYNEIDAVLGCRNPQTEGVQGRTFLNVVIKEEEEGKLQNALPPVSSASENITEHRLPMLRRHVTVRSGDYREDVSGNCGTTLHGFQAKNLASFFGCISCCAQPVTTISRDEEEDEVLPQPQSGAEGVTADTEAPIEEETMSTSSEDPVTASRKRTEHEHDCSVPKKRMKVKRGTMFQRHIGTIINTFMDYQRKAEERFYKWEEERRREEREHELRIIQLLLDHSRSSMIQTPQTPDYLRSLHSQNTHIFTPSPSNN
ncbi:uncharacterized protein LOC132397202 isoform X2 [Hypanus sabinus]|uniref:uncharacterized protein LOC132397202 isoform X2 n=1 Tax=Hypanus sabinus TaxID=79690 RepID=UPI0028C3C45E|nr:uncharacterized protein LOC132397202 isoform X2 [Hypanus sabinus]